MPRLFSVTAAALCISIGCGPVVVPSAAGMHTRKTVAADKGTALSPREKTLQALNRLTFGPRPGDVQRVEAMGIDQWMEQQLHPDKIDDAAVQAMLEEFPAMQLSGARLIEKFPPNPMLRNMEKTNAPLPRDPIEHAIYANQMANYKSTLKLQAANKAVDAEMAKGTSTLDMDAMKGNTMAAVAKPQSATGTDDANPQELSTIQSDKLRLLSLPANQRFQALLALTPGEPRKLMQRLKQPERLTLVEGFTPEQKEVTIALADSNRVIAGEAMEDKLVRDIYSERQLQEVMTDFWLNHFNVYLRKSGIAPWQIATYERDVIRPHALGKFEDLLKAVATSPAMMEYLDNASSIGPDSKAAQGAAWRAANGQGNEKATGRGLNENYARELMELHTLGVNGGYTQQDVTEVAKVFTGWTVAPPRDGGGFLYMDRRHEPGDKHLLGKTIHDNGQQEGFEVLHMLAINPAAAKFISRKLAVRFVSDTPPQALVDAMAKSYLASHGDISEVLRTMLRSQDFWTRDSYRAKVKTPLEYVVSSVRATETDASHPQSLISSLNQMGMPIYGMQPPTGYAATSDAWINSAALLTRMNFGLALASNKLPGLRCDLTAITGATPAATNADPKQDEARLEQVLLNGVVSSRTHQTVLAEMQKLPEQEQSAQAFAAKTQAENQADPLDAGVARKNRPAARAVNLNVSLVGTSEASIAAGLLLGSPDFQRK